MIIPGVTAIVATVASRGIDTLVVPAIHVMIAFGNTGNKYAIKNGRMPSSSASILALSQFFSPIIFITTL